MSLSNRIVEIAGRKIQVASIGEGTPAVVLISGAGGLSVFWSRVDSAVAAFTRVITYDRPGYLSSEEISGNVPLTAGRAAEELHLLLKSVDVSPPFVLVGHSLGGFITRLYASRYPNEVAGMVLLDADHEEEWTSRYPEEHRKGLRLVTSTMKLLSRLAYLGIPQLIARLRTPAPLQHLPKEARQIALSGFSVRTLHTIAREFEAMEQSASEVRTEATSMGSMPLIVIRRGKPGPVAPGVSPEQAEALEQLAAQSQEELARLSSNGELWAAESGHDIHIEQPELVVQAIRTIVQRIRQSHP